MRTRVLAMLVPLLAGGCGTYVPALNEGWEVAEVDDDLVYRIRKSIFCELRVAMHDLSQVGTTIKNVRTHELPDDWGAQITMTLQVDETGALNPSARYIHADPVKTFGLPITAQLSSQATRRDIYYAFFTTRALIVDVQPPDTSCYDVDSQDRFTPIDRHGSSLLFSDLGIKRWLSGALTSRSSLPSSPLPKSLADKDVLSYDVRFIVMTNGTVNPSWKLVNLSVGEGSPLLSANRTRTHEVLITLGPNGTSDGKAGPSQSAREVHFSGELYSAVSNGFQAAMRQ